MIPLSLVMVAAVMVEEARAMPSTNSRRKSAGIMITKDNHMEETRMLEEVARQRTVAQILTVAVKNHPTVGTTNILREVARNLTAV